jgi:hypothetical protein
MPINILVERSFGSPTSTFAQAEAARDAYFSARPESLRIFNKKPHLVIELIYDISGQISYVYQSRIDNEWVYKYDQNHNGAESGGSVTFNLIGNLPTLSDTLVFLKGFSYVHVGPDKSILIVKAAQGVSDTTTQGTLTFKVNNVAKSSTTTLSSTAGTMVELPLLAPVTITDGDKIDFSFVDGGTGDAQHMQITFVTE